MIDAITIYKELLDLPLAELIVQANKVRRDFNGKKLELCSIINAKSGLCGEDCKFCAQSTRHRANIDRYTLKSKKEIISAAENAKKIGADKFGIVTSGNRISAKELDRIIEAVSEIKEKTGMVVCASLGALDKPQLKMLKSAGLTRYHHNIETASRFYPHVVTTHTFEQRISTISAAKQTGLEVCSGGIIGMGENWEDRISMACVLKRLAVDAVPINILVPVNGTPFEQIKSLSVNDAIRTIAIFRIILPDKIIKIAAGRETVLRDFQGMGFMAGANGILIGGYLTIKGRSIEMDQALVEEIKDLWSK